MYTVLSGGQPSQEVRRPAWKRLLQHLRSRRRRKPAGLDQYLKPSLLKVGLVGETAEAVIDELLDVLASHVSLDNREQVRAEIMEREQQMSTGLAHGVAIPHARTDAVGTLVCAVGTSITGVDFGAMDGKPSRIVLLSLSPRDKPAPHVQFMAMISRALDEEGRRRVLAAEDEKALWAALVR